MINQHNDAIAEMYELLKQSYISHWLLPLVKALESIAVGLSLDWSVKVLQPKLAIEPLETRELLRSWLLELPQAQDDADSLMSRANEIWYYYAERTPLRARVSHLYAAKGGLIRGEHLGYAKAVARAVMAQAFDDNGNILWDEVADLVKSFSEFILQSPADASMPSAACDLRTTHEHD
jgi:hypothetical protein